MTAFDDINLIHERLGKEPHLGAIILLAENYLQQHQPDAAAAVARRGLDLYPDNLDLRLILGEALAALGQDDGAEEALLPIVVEIRRLAKVYRLLARLYRQQGRADAAQEAETILQLLEGQPVAEPADEFWNLEVPRPSDGAPVEPPAAPDTIRRTLETWLHVVQAKKIAG